MLRSGQRYLGIIEAPYIARVLGVPVAYYSLHGLTWKLRFIAHHQYRVADLRNGDVFKMPIAFLLFVQGPVGVICLSRLTQRFR
jgi:hypothetical protein